MADLGYRLLRRHWRKGLASEGARELVRYGFDDIGLDRVIAQTLAVNAGSRAVMERVGLSYVRTFPTSMTEPVEGSRGGRGGVRDDAQAVGAPHHGSGRRKHRRAVRAVMRLEARPALQSAQMAAMAAP